MIDELAPWRDEITELHRDMRNMKLGKAQVTYANYYCATHLTAECPTCMTIEEEANFVNTR